MIVRDGVDYESLDDEPAHLFFLIAAPAGGANVHLEVLSRLSRMLMDDDFRDNLMKAQTPEEYLAIIDKAEAEQVAAEEAEAAAEAAAEEAPAETETAAPSDRPYVIGVTACPTGIAHTYMAAEALENKATAMGVDIKIETNGSGGVKNHLTQADIDRAVGVIVACDKDVPVQRFAGKPVIFTKVANGIKIPEELIQTVLDGKAPIYQGNESSSEAVDVESAEKESVGRQIYKHLMNGVSHMLPFVIGGGILIALAFLCDMDNAGTANFGSGTPLAAFLKNVGGLSFSMMMPILAGYIAMSIGERPALMPGIVGGFLATTGGSGFFGALFAGFIAGYLIIFLKKALAHLPEALDGTKSILFYPVLGLVLIGVIMTYIINPPTSVFNTWLFDVLNSMTTSSRIVLGFILGGMMSIDFGGPINKAAYVFATSRYSEHPASASRENAKRVISAPFTADFTSDPRRQTDRRTRGRTSADVPDKPVPSRICRTYTAGHRPAWVCRIRRRTCPYSPRRSCTSSRLPVLLAFLCRIRGRTFRLPSRRTAGISSFLPPASAPAFCCRSSGRNCR